MTKFDHRKILRAMFDAAVASAQPELCVPRYLPPKPKGRTIVIGAGKASAAMAQVLEAHWDGPLEGIVVTRYGYEAPCQQIEIVQAAHPVPDAAGLQAAQRIQQLVTGLTPDDLVIALISGGGSSLLVSPGPGLSLADKQSINSALLQCGASITEMNCVRRHLSAVKGGRLGAACYPAQLVTLLISDVPGDDPSDIASGPTVTDKSTCEDALAIINRYCINISDAVRQALGQGELESVKPGDARLQSSSIHMITAPQMSLEAAAQVALAAGITPYILGDSLEGQSRDLGKAFAGIARQVVKHGQPFQTPCVLLSGGETTVSVTGDGRGGRNVEFLLSLAIAIDGLPDVYALAGDTDGVDGIEEIAGAYLAPDSLSRAWKLGINPRKSLDNNDGHGFFQALGDAVVTGPTRTNVNDFRAIFIDTPSP